MAWLPFTGWNQSFFGDLHIQGTEGVHGAPLGDDEIAATREQLDWPYAPFEIPEAIRAAWDCREAGAEAESAWQKTMAEYRNTHPELAAELDRRQAAGLPMNLEYAELAEFLDPFYRTYECADGRGFYVVSGSVAGHPNRVLRTLGLEDLLEELPDFDPYLDTRDWPDEWALGNYPVGDRDREKVSSAMKEAFLKRPSWEWEELFGAAKAPATASNRLNSRTP